MALRVVGAGLGRTGTHSLKLAIEQLLGGPCYHMMETFSHPDDIPVWHAAVDGNSPDWSVFLGDYVATVDWPAAAFWRELADANPEAVVLLSSRSSADAWWKSANDTIFQISRREIPPEHRDAMGAQLSMAEDMLTNTFTADWTDETAAKRAYEEHNSQVRAMSDRDRLIDWQPGDGWTPICAALALAVPDEPFPHVNTTSDFRAQAGLDQ
jgi:Sulfotransferase domain